MATPEVDVCRREVIDALVVSIVVVKFDERFDLRLQIRQEEVIFQQDAVLQGLMPSFDPALTLWMIRRPPDMPHIFVAQPLSQLARDVAAGVLVR